MTHLTKREHAFNNYFDNFYPSNNRDKAKQSFNDDVKKYGSEYIDYYSCFEPMADTTARTT